MNPEQERQKWDRYYASLSIEDEGNNVLRFREEVIEMVAALLPDGGHILEAGSGAGEQSLALAKTNRYDLTLLDFSTEAIKKARQVFGDANLPASFLIEDALQLGKPEYDLVFNAGVLEHYSFEQQVAMLQGMASRSKKYVLVLVPNFQNYWYWIWRIQKSGQGLWPFGKEIPSMDLAEVFEAAGLHYLGKSHVGSSWTESFITGLEGISPQLSELLLNVHRSGILSESQTSYLVVGLGSIDDTPSPMGWGDSVRTSGMEVETITSALADALALQVSKERETDSLRVGILSEIETLKAKLHQLEQTNVVDLVQRVEDIQRQSSAVIEEKIQSIEKSHEARLAAQIKELEQKSAGALRRELREIEQKKFDDLTGRIAEFEQQRDIDHAGVIRQIEHDHTGVLVGKIQEIDHLRRQVNALRAPLTLSLRQRFKAFLIRIFTKLGLISYAIRFKKILKKIRHIFKVQVPSDVSYQPPVSLGHPAVSPDRRVMMLSYTFFDFDGENMFFGGAERYLLELAKLIREQGYYPEVVQCGNGYWVRYYQDLRVTGIDVRGEATRLATEFQKFECAAALTTYSPFSLATQVGEGAAVGISHGIYWDHPSIHADQDAMQAITAAAQKLDSIISVDTNTINWMRASAFDVVDKFVYIPNFVDTEIFSPAPDVEDEKIVVLYPRRLYKPRGFWLVAEMLPDILERYPQVEFYFVGRADDKEAQHIGEMIKRYPDRIRWEVLPPDEMHKAYQQAHITLVPTMHSEGTSLSCLEALASGNAVIATNVGGLPNLILHDHNGLLIDVTAEALRDALEKLIENPALRKQLATCGREVAESFSIHRWRAQWKEILIRHLIIDEKRERIDPQVAFFPIAPGIPWEGIKQRPHHLAMQLAKGGIETFWQNPTQRLTSPHELLHILGPQEDVNLLRPVVFIYYPFNYTKLDHYDDPFIVYDILDDVSIHKLADDTLPEGIRAVDYHQRLLDEADLVITSSQVLYQRIKPQRADVKLIPNGVDLEHFKSDPSRLSKDSPIANEKPCIGFHGAIADWIEVELLHDIAKLRSEYEFELIGSVSIDIKQLSLPNITHRAAVNYDDIPKHIARFDVGILPFNINPMTHAVRPLKVLEYLAMGKPVVSTPLDELHDWPGVLFADTPQTFAEQLDHALANRDSISSNMAIQEFISSASWEKTTSPLIERLLSREHGEV
ncbi:MAG: glycosyltransferase [Anaerolineales bacterium]|nr:glycosyltransferase [Chloroflexota bacterium]MBL6979840.1 glycosyltransferase [Anaerolineales bacterium]